MNKITISKQGHNINVIKNGEVVKSFCEISNDYAHANAKKYADKLRRAERDTDREGAL